MENQIDRTPRYAPARTFIFKDGNAFDAPITSYVAHPANSHPKNCPIKSEYVALEMITDAGSAWWGFERAYINSELRMVVIGFPSRDEIRSKWEICSLA